MSSVNVNTRGEAALDSPSVVTHTRPARHMTPPQNVNQLERFASFGLGSLMVLGGLSRGRLSGLLMGVLGGSLIHRGITGHCYLYESLGINTAEHPQATAVAAQEGVKVEETITIQRSPEEIYQFWRNLENLPRVMRHLKEVRVLDDRRSHWVAEGPMGTSVQWDAEILNERENEMIAWRSLPGGDIATAGSVRFTRLQADGGTAVVVSMKYNPPAGKIGATIASWLGSGLEQEMSDDLQRLKTIMEAGEVTAPSPGQPTGPV